MRNKNAIEAAILNRVLDRDWTLNCRGPLRLKAGPQKPQIICNENHYLAFFRKGKDNSSAAWDPGDLVQDPKMGIPEKCWQGCWHRCWQKWGFWAEYWCRCWQALLSLFCQRAQPASTCASTPASTPIFASTCASTSASTFLEFPFLGPVPGRRDLKARPKLLLENSLQNERLEAINFAVVIKLVFV